MLPFNDEGTDISTVRGVTIRNLIQKLSGIGIWHMCSARAYVVPTRILDADGIKRTLCKCKKERRT